MASLYKATCLAKARRILKLIFEALRKMQHGVAGHVEEPLNFAKARAVAFNREKRTL